MTIVKRYISIQPLHKLNVEVKIQKNYIRVLFSNGGTANGGNATYVTSDEKIQKALEESPMFGKIYKIQSAENDGSFSQTQDSSPMTSTSSTEHSEEQNGTITEKLTFANYNELRDFLVSEHNCTPAEVRTTELAIAKAKELGIDVLIEK